MKVAIVDLETTGLDAYKHEIIDIGAIIFDSKNPSDHTIIDCKVKPQHIENAEPAALKVNGYNAEEWKDALPLDDALQLMLQKASGAIFVSYNVTFDWSFIAEAYKKSPIRNPFNYHKFCLMTLAWARVPGARSLKLRDICLLMDIPPEPEVHKALNGAKRAFELYRKITMT